MKTTKTFKSRTAKQWLDVADIGEMQSGTVEINKGGYVFASCQEGMAIRDAGGLVAILELNPTQRHRLDQLVEYRDNQ